MRPVQIVFAASLLYGCAATPYQSLDDSLRHDEGFSERQLEPNSYEVSFRGNSRTSSERASDFALLRASELCLLNGYAYFVVASTENTTMTAMSAPESQMSSQSTANLFGIEPTAVSITTRRGAPRPTYIATKPGQSLVIAFLDEPVETAEHPGPIYEAAPLRHSLRAKYEMPLADAPGDARIQ